MKSDIPREQRQTFLDSLADFPVISRACRKAKIGRTAAFRLRESDEDFKREWDAAIDIGISVLEDEMVIRAKNGSDRLLMFYLRAFKPAKYRENYDDDKARNGDPPPLTIRLVR